MRTTYHALQRMNQRGITKRMVDIALEYGKIFQDKAVLGKKETLRLIEKKKDEIRVLQKICDKGGVVVVAEGENVITTYNYNQEV